MKVLVTAATKHGATGEIAQAIADTLRDEGLEPTVLEPERVDTVDGYDAVVLGSAVYAGHWLKPARDLVGRCDPDLAARPVWLFSSGPVGDPPKPEEDPVDVAEFLAATSAREHRVFAGKLVRKQLAFPRAGDRVGPACPRRRLPRLAGDHRLGGRHRHRPAVRPRPGRRLMMRARVDRLGAGDLATLWAEELATPFHIGLAGLLDPGPLLDEHGQLRLQEVRAAVEARLVRVPELRRRIRWTGFGQGRPAVVDDHDFDIARHLTTVDLAGVDEPGFWSWCANQTLQPLDREHPMWRVILVTGLASGQIGVLVVMHHALADGIAGAVLAQRLLDPGPDTTVTAEPWRPAPPPGPLALAVDAVVSRLATIATALRHLPNAPTAIRAAGREAAATRAALAHSAPTTSLDHPIGPGRQLVVIRRPLERVRQAGHAHGATVNDVLLAAVAGGLHEPLVGRGEPVEGLELRVSVPVGAPGRARNAGGSTPMVLPLSVGPLDPVSRLTRIAAATRAAKAGRDRHYRGVLASPLLPTSLLWLGIRWLRRRGGTKVNLYVSNVPGPPGPLWLAGARLQAAVPIAPLVAGVPLAVAALSYAGELAISIQVDDAMADLDTLAAGVADHLDQLTASGRLPAITGRRG